jgi:hypothetical protein
MWKMENNYHRAIITCDLSRLGIPDTVQRRKQGNPPLLVQIATDQRIPLFTYVIRASADGIEPLLGG